MAKFLPVRMSSALDIRLSFEAHPPRIGAPATSRDESGGFTLVELVVAIAIAALLIGLGVTMFHDWLGQVQLANHAKHLAESMIRARTEAIRTGNRVNLCKSSDNRSCASSGGWESGFLVYVDANGDGAVEDARSVLAVGGRAPPGITVTANKPVANYVSYTSLGTARTFNGALQMGTLTVCRRGYRAMHVVLAGSGRVRIERSEHGCP